VEGGVGSLFMDLNDAKGALQQLEQKTASSSSSSGESLEVSYTTLDDVYYPLVTRKGKVAPSGKFKHLNILSIIPYTLHSTQWKCAQHIDRMHCVCVCYVGDWQCNSNYVRIVSITDDRVN
jgi:hypothetical protein